MPRARKKPSLPPMPVEWVDTEAQNAGCEIKVRQDPGKAPVRVRHRDHYLEHLARPQEYKNQHGTFRRNPKITTRQCNAGIALFEAWCDTQRSPGPVSEYVQSSPDWDAITLAQVEKSFGYAQMAAMIPREYADVVKMAVLQQIPVPEKMADLRKGLSALAKGLNLS